MDDGRRPVYEARLVDGSGGKPRGDKKRMTMGIPSYTRTR